MFCPNCGTNNPDNAVKCSYCGSDLAVSEVRREQTPANQQQAEQPRTEAPAYQQPQSQFEQYQPQAEQPRAQYYQPQTEAPVYQQPQSQFEQYQPQAEQPRAQYYQPQTEAPSYQQPQAQYRQPQAEAPSYQQPQSQFEQYQPQAEQPMAQPEQAQFGYKEKPKKKKKNFVPLIIAGSAVLLIAAFICCAIFTPLFPKTSNLINRYIASPKTYTKKSVNATITGKIDDNADSYDKALTAFGKSEKAGTEVIMDVKVGEGGRQLLKNLTNLDFSWVNSAKLVISEGVDNGKVCMLADVYLNDYKFTDISVVLDTSGKSYIKCGLLGDSYFVANNAQSNGTSASSNTVDLTALSKALPDADTLKSILIRYANILTDSLEEVERFSTVVDADGVEQKCTCVSFTVDKDYLDVAVYNLLNELVADEDIKTIIKGMGADYKSFTKSINEKLDEMEDDDDYYSDVLSTDVELYIDNEGQIIGIFVQNKEISFYFANVEDGENYGIALEVKDGNSSTVKAYISGTKEDDLYSGSVKIKSNGITLTLCDFEDVYIGDDTEDAQGKVTFNGSNFSAVLAKAGINADVAQFVGTCNVKLEWNTKNTKLTVDGNGSNVCEINLSGKEKDVAIPDTGNVADINSVSSNDIASNFLNGLKAAGASAVFLQNLISMMS